MENGISSKLKVRGHDVGVRVVVCGWDDFAWNLHLPLLERVEQMVANGYSYGQPEHEIEEDILDLFMEIFSNVEVEVGEGDEIEVRLEPVGLLASP